MEDHLEMVQRWIWYFFRGFFWRWWRGVDPGMSRGRRRVFCGGFFLFVCFYHDKKFMFIFIEEMKI